MKTQQNKIAKMSPTEVVDVMMNNGFDHDDIEKYFEIEGLHLWHKDSFQKDAKDVRGGRRVVAGLFEQGLLSDLTTKSVDLTTQI